MGGRQRRMVSTWEPNTSMTTCVIEVRGKEEVQRLEKIKGDTLDRVNVMLGVVMWQWSLCKRQVEEEVGNEMQ